MGTCREMLPMPLNLYKNFIILTLTNQVQVRALWLMELVVIGGDNVMVLWTQCKFQVSNLRTLNKKTFLYNKYYPYIIHIWCSRCLVRRIKMSFDQLNFIMYNAFSFFHSSYVAFSLPMLSTHSQLDEFWSSIIQAHIWISTLLEFLWPVSWRGISGRVCLASSSSIMQIICHATMTTCREAIILTLEEFLKITTSILSDCVHSLKLLMELRVSNL